MRMTTRPIRILIIGLLVLSVSACAAPNRQDANFQGMGTNQQGTNQADGTGNTWGQRNANRLHQNTKLVLSQEIAEQVVSLDEVRTANVLVTDRNAYVAVVLDQAVSEENPERAANKVRGGITNRHTHGQARTGTRDNENPLGTGANPYDDVAAGIKSKIAEQVRQVHPTVQNVYVSANPDFVNRVDRYTQQIMQGRPVRGFINEFNAMVERVFPMNVNPDQPLTAERDPMGRTAGPTGQTTR